MCSLLGNFLSMKLRIISFVLCISRLPEAQQRVGGCFLNLMPQMKTLYLAYCANHPSAVNVLTEHRCTCQTPLPGGQGLLGKGFPPRWLVWATRYMKYSAGIHLFVQRLLCFNYLLS